MIDLQQEKKLVLDFLNSIDKTENKYLGETIFKYTSEDFQMRCTHPFNELKGAKNIADNLWIPIKNSFSPIQRRMDIFYAGTNLRDISAIGTEFKEKQLEGMKTYRAEPSEAVLEVTK